MNLKVIKNKNHNEKINEKLTLSQVLNISVYFVATTIYNV